MRDIIPCVIRDAMSEIVERNNSKRGGNIHSVDIPKGPVDFQCGVGAHQGICSRALHDSRNTIRKLDQPQRIDADVPPARRPEAETRDGTMVGRIWRRR